MKKRVLFIALYFLSGCLQGTGQHPNQQLRPPQSDAEIRFAKGVLDAAQAASIANNREYCGYIGLNNGGNFVATPAKQGRQSSCLARRPQGIQILASYHTHGAFTVDYDTEVPSVSDLEADIFEGIDGYIATPGGRVWYDDSSRRAAVLLCGINCITSDPNFIQFENLPAGTVFNIDDLLGRE